MSHIAKVPKNKMTKPFQKSQTLPKIPINNFPTDGTIIDLIFTVFKKARYRNKHQGKQQ
jgi:hypothetical protein